MYGKTSKRSSDDYVFVDTKKKKIAKDKQEVLSAKTAIVCNGDLRQKKAFFAFFGKSFDDSKNNIVNRCGNDSIKTRDINITTKGTNQITSTNNGGFSSQTLAKINAFKSAPQITNRCVVKKNESLSFVSSFAEELGCFPKITHTNRATPLSCLDIMLHLNEAKLHDNHIKSLMPYFQTINTVQTVTKQMVLKPYETEIHFPYMISSLKKAVPNFPFSQFQKYMKKRHSQANKSTTIIKSLWIDKYKPMCKEEILGNSELVKSLKNWLKPVKKKLKPSNKSQKYDDDEDFIFCSDSDSSHTTSQNMAIIFGPSGCGKTSAIYAVANEINANVIELNASCNRNGKRIITDLIEATQSHAVEKNCLLNMMKGKKKKPKGDVNEKMTIILIEDADIFFENYDDGFMAAISTLANDSKRPLILVANDPFNNNLLKFLSSNEITLHFIHPSKEELSCFLQLMALNEGAIISEDEINAFIHPFKPDIRQSTLQLQYILSSGEIADKNTSNISYKKNINSIWWNWPYVFGCDSIKKEKDEQVKSNIDIATISQNLDDLSKLNLIHSKTQSYDSLDPQPFWYHLLTRDSASLIETHQWSDNSIQLSTDIIEWIQSRICTQNYTAEKLYPSSEELRRRQKTWNISKDILEQIGLDYCNRKNKTCFDYLATIRSIGRNQQMKPFGNLRNSKMFSYLEQININVDSKNLKYLCNSLLSSSICDQPKSDQF